MKNYLFILLIITLPFTFCKKTKTPGTISSILVYNATHSISNLKANWNNVEVTPIGLAQGKVSGITDSPYQRLPAGTNNIILMQGANTFLNKNAYTGSTNGYSLLVYDTAMVAGKSTAVLIADDFKEPDTASLHLRFINCVPDDSLQVDVWLVNNNRRDSVLIIDNVPFIGKEPIIENIQTFGKLTYHGESYTVKIKKAGTDQMLIFLGKYLFKEKQIYSLILSGLPTGIGSNGLKLVAMRHPIEK